MIPKFTVGQRVVYRKERRCRILKIHPEGKKYKINSPGITFWVREEELEACL